MLSMESLWLLLIVSLLGSQPARGSPLTSASSEASIIITGGPTLNWSANVSATFTSQKYLFINSSTKATNISGLVTVFKTLELIPQPVSSDSPEGGSSSINAQQAALPTTSPSAQPTGSAGPSISSSSQVPLSQPVDQSVKCPKLQPIIVGGITYAPVHAHHTHSNVSPWQANPRASQTNSEAIEWHEYYATHNSEPHGLDRETLESGEEQGGLPPIVVGDLTYRPIGQEVKPGLPTPAPVNVAGSAQEITKSVANPSLEGGTMSLSAQPGSMAASSPYSASPGVSSPVSTQSQSPTSSPASPTIILGSQTITPFFGSSSFIPSSSTLPPGSPAITVNSNSYSLNSSPSKIAGQSIIPASPSTFIIANQTFTAYPSGLAISGTEVFQGSTAITLSGTAISLGSSDIVIGTSTIPFASVTGLGAAISSGLDAVASTPVTGAGPTPTSTLGKSAMVCFVVIALTITIV